MTTQPKGRLAAPAIDTTALKASIVERGLLGLPVTEQLAAACADARKAGIPLDRVNLGMATLHPRYGANTYVWRPDAAAVEVMPRERTGEQFARFVNSPVYYMRKNRLLTMRMRLDTNEPLPYRILEELREEGMTEYAARIVVFDPNLKDMSYEGGVFFSCATRRPAGFEDDQLGAMSELMPPLALALKSRATYDVATTVLSTYLGEDAGNRVLTGAIERGSVESIRAVIWLCDLRNFTAFSDTASPDELIETLDDYLETMARPVLDNSGQILKFLGDGFLATFDLTGIEDEAMGVCSRATSAARQLSERFPAINAEREAAGKPVMDFGLALHLGEVLYGNIGTAERLDFTVIGPAVNEASRIQALCRPLERNVLISSAYHEIAYNCRAYLRSTGFHALRGVREPQELFTLGG